VDFDWVFADARVPGGAVDSVSGAGHLALGGPDGTVLDTLTLRRADLDLRSVRLVAPSVPLRGRVQAAGTLAGPWTDVTFDGTLTHQDGARPPSTVVGRVRLDTRTDTTAFDGDVAFDPLALDGIRASFPGLAALGELRGRVGFSGTSERLRLDADLSGELGHVAARGVVGARAAGWRAESLAVAFRDLDLARVTGRGPATSLNGTATLDGVADSGAAPEGSLRLALSESDAGALPIDSAAARIRAAGGLLTFDTLALAWPGGAAGGRGPLAWRAPANGRLDLVANAHDLRPLDSLFKTLTGWQPDTAAETRTLSGAATGGLTLSGALDSLSADATLRVSDLAAGPARVPGAGAVVRWQAGARPAVAATLTVDTAVVGGVGFAGGELRLRGFTDSASWQLGTRVGPVDTVTAGGAWTRAGQRTVVALDSLRGVLTAHTWRLAAPTRVVLTDSGVAVDSLRLAAEDGLGELRLAGAAPGTAAGDLRIHALDLDARDLAGFFGRDTLGLTGMVSADLRMGGTAAAPTLRGTASLADAGAGDFRGPYAQGIVDYAGHRLELNALLWKTGRPVMSAQAHLPVDLALTPVDRRLLPGPLDIRVTADSADLGMLEAFTRNARQLHGWVSADAGVEGTWDAPRLTGYVAIRNGGASFPSLGVRYDEIDGRARLAGDTIALDSLTLRSGGTAAVGGSVRLVALTRPVLDLSVDAHGFRAIDARNYLTLIASGKLRLTGPVFGATLAGRMTADEGVLYFADLVTKQVVDLSDPATVALIDTAFARDATLRPSVENRFVDSLNIANLRVSVGDEFWLRSTEANIRLAGDVTVNKAARNYRLDGTLKADRGTYALKIGFITRPFTVQSGTVQFLGTPDLNAELDIQALHTVRPSDATADIPVVAHITGTTLAPKLALSSPQNPTLSETELVSYLMFGRPSFALDQTTAAGPGSSEQAALQTGLAYLSSALSSEIERALVSDLGVPVDFVEIRPGGAGGSFVSANAGLTTLSAGWRIGNRTFFTFNAGLCPNLGQLSYRSFGASIEQRLNPWVRAQASVEPVRTCQPNVAVDALGATNQYQLGFDLLWDREY
jgi:translocation and assembly module TamB